MWRVETGTLVYQCACALVEVELMQPCKISCYAANQLFGRENRMGDKLFITTFAAYSVGLYALHFTTKFGWRTACATHSSLC